MFPFDILSKRNLAHFSIRASWIVMCFEFEAIQSPDKRGDKPLAAKKAARPASLNELNDDMVEVDTFDITLNRNKFLKFTGGSLVQ